MKLSIRTIVVLLPLVASSLHPKVSNKNENNDNVDIIEDTDFSDNNANNIILDNSHKCGIIEFVSKAPQLTWNKSELARLVRELRHLAITRGSYSDAVNMEQILMKTDYREGKEEKDDAYYELLSQRIATFADEAVYHGFKIGGAIRKVIDVLSYATYHKLRHILVKSSSVEVKAAALSEWGTDGEYWNKYFSDIKEDGEVQRRLLELIDLECSEYSIKILQYWGQKLGVEIKFCPSSFFNSGLSFCFISLYQILT